MTKGVILAGGTGSRMAPCTQVTNKHLLPVGEFPMIFHPLNLLKKMGVTDIMVTVGGESIGEFLELLGSGAKYGLNLTFRVQDTANGIAGAMLLTEDFVDNNDMVVVLGDNIFDPDDFELEDSILTGVQPEFLWGTSINLDVGAKLFLKNVDCPERFGVATLSNDEQSIESIIEKPSNPPTDLAVTGLYMYGAGSGIFDVLRILKPSHRGELEITDVNNYFVDKGDCEFKVLDGYWSDAGTWDSWQKSNCWAFDNLDKMELVESDG